MLEEGVKEGGRDTLQLSYGVAASLRTFAQRSKYDPHAGCHFRLVRLGKGALAPHPIWTSSYLRVSQANGTRFRSS